MRKELTYCLFLISLLIVSCDFGNINVDPIRPTDVELHELLPAALSQSTRNIGSIGGRVTGAVVQHLLGIDAQPESYSQYLIEEQTLNTLWESGLYTGAMKDCRLIMDKAKEQDQPHYEAIASILMAVNLGILTSYWGDVPYSQALQGAGNLQAEYDNQESVYLAIQALLGRAIQLLQAPAVENGPAEDDLIFRGDPGQWTATARALQARYYLQLSRRDPDAAGKALAAIRSGAFTDPQDQPDFPFGSTLNEANPLPLFCIERPDQLELGPFLYEYMAGRQDPRLLIYADTTGGRRSIYRTSNPHLYWTQPETPLPLISLTEVRFIEAEALLRLSRQEEAAGLFRQAVEANLHRLGVPEEAGLYFLDAHIHFENLITTEERLEHLISQKYVALYAQGANEVWVDYRRTGYPRLTPPPNANPSFNPSLVIPRRYLYPISERITNAAHLNAAIERQGGHLLDVALWAFQ